MIYAFFVINENGEIRLARSYIEMSQETRNRLAHEVFRMVSTRPSNLCNIIPGDSISSYSFSRKVSIVYRSYASLFVITIVDECENPLAILDIIHTFVEVLNGCFRDVSEVQLAFNPDKALQVLDSLINGGLIFETNQELALQRLAEENEADKRFGIKMNYQKKN